MKPIRRLIISAISGINLLFAALLAASAFSPYIDPCKHPALSCFGLAFPVFLLLNLLFILFWFFLKKKHALISIAALLICGHSVRTYFPVNLHEEAPQESFKLVSYNVMAFANDIKQVWETLRIKGWPLGPAMFTRHPILSARLILAPILFRALKSSETLGVAAELKGMGSRERTVLVDAKTMTSLDARVYSVLLLTLVFVAAAEVLLADLWMPTGSQLMP